MQLGKFNIRLIGSWKWLYVGFNINKQSYYVCWLNKNPPEWGYVEDYYDGPIKSFFIGKLCFQTIYENLDFKRNSK